MVEGIDEGEVDVLVEEVEDKIFLVDVGEIDEGGIVDGFYDLEFFLFFEEAGLVLGLEEVFDFDVEGVVVGAKGVDVVGNLYDGFNHVFILL